MERLMTQLSNGKEKKPFLLHRLSSLLHWLRYTDFEQLAKQLKEGYSWIAEYQNLTLPQSNLVDRPFDSEDNQRETDELQQFMDKVVKVTWRHNHIIL